MSYFLRFILIDSYEKNITHLSKIITTLYPQNNISYATEYDDAIKLINQSEASIILINLDTDDLNQKELISLSESKNSYIIGLTSEISNKFTYDDFIPYPIEEQTVSIRIKLAARVFNYQQEINSDRNEILSQKRLLEDEINDLIEVACKFIQARLPNSYEMLKRVADASVWIASQLNEFNNKEIKILRSAALLAQSGKVFLPDNIIKQTVTRDGIPTDELMYQVPVAAREILASAKTTKPIADILYSLYENLDGSGFPDKLQSWQIPLASRIIRVALFFEESMHRNGSDFKQIISDMRRKANRLYDPRVIELMIQYAETVSGEVSRDERAIVLPELQPGMILTRDIVTSNGNKLIGADSVLTDRSVRIIRSHTISDPVLGFIYIKSTT